MKRRSSKGWFSGTVQAEVFLCMKIEGPGLSRKVSLRAELVFSLAGLKRRKDISINTLS